ncbi:MAG: GNAT family N-acetyltransferase [Pirellulaceae bacterium]
MIRVIEINEIPLLSHIRENWERLWQETPSSGFFQTLPWLETYWKHFSEGKRLRVLLIVDGETMIGIVPLVVTSEKTKLGTVHVLTYPLADWGNQYGPLGRNQGRVLEIAATHIRNTPRDWELFDLRWIGPHDQAEAITQAALERAGLPNHSGTWSETTTLQMEGTWEDYLRSRSPKMRAELRRILRKVPVDDALRFVRYRPAGDVRPSEVSESDPRWKLFEDAVQIASQSWQHDSTTGTTLCHEDVRPFLAEAHAEAARLGMLDLCLLYHQGQPAAFCYNYHDTRGNLFGLRRGNTQEARRRGLGSTLMTLMLHDSFQRQDKSLDLGLGALQSKRRWMTDITRIGRCTHYPAHNPRVQLLRLKHWWNAHHGPQSSKAEITKVTTD